jgi:hypothetical protein
LRWSGAVALAVLGCHSHNGMRLEACADLGVTDSAPEPEDALPQNPDTAPDALPQNPDTAPDALPPDTLVESTIVGRCTVDDDCLPVLDYRAGFICWAPVPASKEDVVADPCLVPWWPDALCSTAPPPSTCIGGLGHIPVTHSCAVVGCLVPVCRRGNCALNGDLSGSCPFPKDCPSLRAAYVNTLAAAQTCYPSSSICRSELVDVCGCPAAHDWSDRCTRAASTAFKGWQNAGCPMDSCKTCPAPTGPNPTCVASATGLIGICRL